MHPFQPGGGSGLFELRKVARDAAARNYRWSAIVLGIVRSAPFQMKKTPASDAQQVAAVAAR